MALTDQQIRSFNGNSMRILMNGQKIAVGIGFGININEGTQEIRGLEDNKPQEIQKGQRSVSFTFSGYAKRTSSAITAGIIGATAAESLQKNLEGTDYFDVSVIDTFTNTELMRFVQCQGSNLSINGNTGSAIQFSLQVVATDTAPGSTFTAA